MSTLHQRLERLEVTKRGKGRQIVLRTGNHHSEEDVKRFLAEHGIVEGPDDCIVCLSTIFINRNGEDIPGEGSPVLLSVTPLK